VRAINYEALWVYGRLLSRSWFFPNLAALMVSNDSGNHHGRDDFLAAALPSSTMRR